MEYCLQADCEGSQTLQFLEVAINLTDFTGTLTEAKLSRENVAIVLGLTLEEYVRMTSAQIQDIEDRYLLENYFLSIKFKKFNSSFISIQIMNMILENGLSRF